MVIKNITSSSASMSTGVFIFRRDLRVYDNGALFKISQKCGRVYPVFILDSSQLDETLYYYNKRSRDYMIRALHELNTTHLNGKLIMLRGTVLNSLNIIRKHLRPDYLAFNRDYSKYSVERDNQMLDWCDQFGVTCITYDHDIFLNDYNLYLKQDQTPYLVISSYLKNVDNKKITVRSKFKTVNDTVFVSDVNITKLSQFASTTEMLDTTITTTPSVHIIDVTRASGMKSLKRKVDYESTRKRVDIEQTMLATHLKFGILSCVEAFNQLTYNQSLQRNLHIRNFYFIIKMYNPNDGYNNMYEHKKFSQLEWKNNVDDYKRMWIDACTGFPLIDACVRRLNKTGWLNNRASLLVSFFSIKLLHINPFHEQYGGHVEFSRKLIFCCYANNWANWNFALGTFDWGASRYNPKYPHAGRRYNVSNIRELDPALKLIREYIPELVNVPAIDIINWHRDGTHLKYTQSATTASNDRVTYPGPMFDAADRFAEYERMTLKIKMNDII